MTDILDYNTVHKLTQTLSKQSEHATIHNVLEAIALYQPPPFELDKLIRLMAHQVGSGIKVIRQEYKMTLRKLKLTPPDAGFTIARETLDKFYGGTKLKRYPDGNFYTYDGTHWRLTTTDQVRANIQAIASDYLHQVENTSLKSLVSDAFTSLCDFLGTDEDVLNFQEEPYPIINFLNGELWIGKDGNEELRPHKPESRLFYCLPFAYDPKAKASLYEKVMLDIFAESSNPKEMCRHWFEFFGYAIQPQRFIACFFMMIGHGRNGKSVNLQTIQKVLGPEEASPTYSLHNSARVFFCNPLLAGPNCGVWRKSLSIGA